MQAYIVPLTLRIRQREDGSFIATGNELPILITAKDLGGLKEKILEVQASVESFLASMPEAEGLAYLKERGARPESVGEAEGEDYSMPVLVGA